MSTSPSLQPISDSNPIKNISALLPPPRSKPYNAVMTNFAFIAVILGAIGAIAQPGLPIPHYGSPLNVSDQQSPRRPHAVLTQGHQQCLPPSSGSSRYGGCPVMDRGISTLLKCHKDYACTRPGNYCQRLSGSSKADCRTPIAYSSHGFKARSDAEEVAESAPKE
ncbi:hypothetical protein ANO11243_093590 [Dothideomycetidae sp. 11243]|nr:hypothetical protein ANO11243_093590 [fungal sp. No.11243]